MDEIKSKPKTVSAFFYFIDPESVGNVVIIHTLSFLSRHFNFSIYTNQSVFLQKQLPGVKIISLDHISVKENSVTGMLFYCRRIAKILNSDGSDAVFTGHNYSPIALWLTKNCFQYVYQVHEMLGLDRKTGFAKIKQKIMEYFILKGIRKSNASFVVSEPIMQYLRENHCRNIYLASHCVDLKRFSDPVYTDLHTEIFRKKKQGYFIVCYTGWVSEERGLHLMLESLYSSTLKAPAILFVIAGSDAKYSQEIINYFHKRNLDENLICLGKIDTVYIPGVLALSDVCLSLLEDNPVYRMSPPQKVIEYMAAGKPVIANIIQTHLSLITDEYNGFLTRYDQVSISERILFLKANPDIARQMSENALKTAAKYDTSLAYSEMSKIINGVINKKSVIKISSDS